MSDKGKCDWCGLVFDYHRHKPKAMIDSTGDVICDNCYNEYMGDNLLRIYEKG